MPPRAPSVAELYDSLNNQSATQANAAVLQPREGSPDEAAKTLQNSTRQGVPFSAGNLDPKAFNATAQDSQNQQIVNSSEPVQRYVNDNDYAPHVSADDFPSLARAGAALQNLWGEGVFGGLTGGIHYGFERSRLTPEIQPYQFGLEKELRPEVRERLAELGKEPEYHGASYIANSVGHLVGQFWSAATGREALEATAAGGALGAAAAALPSAGVAAPVGAVGGALGGWWLGTKLRMAQDDAASAYLQLDAERSPTGEKIPEAAKQTAAIATGLMSFAMLHYGADPFVKDFAKETTIAALKEQGAPAALEKMVGKLAEGGATGAAWNYVSTGIDAMAQDLAKASANKDFKTYFNDPDRRADVQKQLAESIMMGFTLGGSVGAFSAGASHLNDIHLVRQAERKAELLQKVFEEMDATNTMSRSIEASQAFVNSAIGGQDITIPAEAILQKFGDRAPEIFKDVPDFVGQMTRSQRGGGDVSFPAQVLLTMPREVRDALRDDMRTEVHEPTLNEAKNEIEPSLPGRLIVRIPEEPVAGQMARIREGMSKAERNVMADLDVKHDEMQSELAVELARSPEGSDKATRLRAAITRNRNKRDQIFGKTDPIPAPVVEGGPTATGLITDFRQNARNEMFLNPMFEDAESAGKTNEEFALYSKKFADQHAEALEAEIERKRKIITREQTQTWKDNRAAVREETENEFRARPDLLADTYFRKGMIGDQEFPRLKMNADAIRQTYGPDLLDSLPKSAVTKKGGVSPDDLAGTLGFKSGGALVRALRDLERRRGDTSPTDYFKNLVDRETDDRMLQRYGDRDELTAQMAREAVGTEKGLADLLSDHVFSLAKKMWGERPLLFTRDDLDRLAREDIDKTNFRQVRSIAFARDMGKAGRREKMALLRGNDADAFRASLDHYIAQRKFAAAVEFEKDRTRIDATYRRYQSPDIYKTRDGAFVDQVHALMQRVGLDVPRPPEAIQEIMQKRPLGQFVNDMAESTADGGQGRLIEPLNLPANKARLEDLTTEEYRDFGKTLESLDFNGKSAKGYERAGKQIAHDDAVTTTQDNLKILRGDRDPKSIGLELDKQNLWQSTRHFVRGFDASMIKMEQLFDWIDRNDPTGMLNKIVFRPLQESEFWEIQKLKAMAKDIKALRKEMKWRPNLQETVENTSLLDRDGTVMPMNREAMLAIAANWGNLGNKTKMLQGRNWDEATVKDWLDRSMKKEDWDAIQHIWDTVNKHLAKDIEERGRRMTGVPVDLVQPLGFDTPFGHYKGGYFPLIEDATARRYREKADPRDLFGGAMFQAMPTAAGVKARTGAIYPVSLSFTDWQDRLQETVHYLAYAEALRDASHFLNDGRIKKAVDETFGHEYTDQFNPWLKSIAGGLQDNSSNHWLTHVMRFGLDTFRMAQIGFNSITAELHGISLLANSYGEVPVRAVVDMTKTTLADIPAAFAKQTYSAVVGKMFRSQADMKTMFDFVYEHSKEIPIRKQTLDEQLYQNLWGFGGRQGGKVLNGIATAQAAYSHFGMSLLSNLDLWSAIAVWKTTYDALMRSGKMSSEDAAYAADKAVRNAHGSSGKVSIPAAQRGDSFQKWLTLFMGYFVHTYNRNRNAARVAMGKSDLDGMSRWGYVAGATLTQVILPAFVHEALRGPDDKESDPDEDGFSRIMRFSERALTWGIADQLTGNVPIVRDMLYAIERAQGKRPDPKDALTSALEGLVYTPYQVLNHYFKYGELHDNDVEKALEWPAHFVRFGVPPLAARRIQFLWDVKNDNVDTPQTPFEWMKDLAFPPEYKGTRYLKERER